MRRIRKSRRGITVVEVVIALVLIAMISASALSVVLSSVEVDKNAAAAVEVKNAAENALECFRFSQDADTFLTALQKTAPYEAAGDGSYTLELHGCKITVQADFAVGQLDFSAVYSDGEELFSYRYPGEGGTE